MVTNEHLRTWTNATSAFFFKIPIKDEMYSLNKIRAHSIIEVSLFVRARLLDLTLRAKVSSMNATSRFDASDRIISLPRRFCGLRQRSILRIA